MKLKRSLAFLLAIAMVITSVNMPVNTKQAKAEDANSWTATVGAKGTVTESGSAEGETPSTKTYRKVTVEVQMGKTDFATLKGIKNQVNFYVTPYDVTGTTKIEALDDYEIITSNGTVKLNDTATFGITATEMAAAEVSSDDCVTKTVDLYLEAGTYMLKLSYLPWSSGDPVTAGTDLDGETLGKGALKNIKISTRDISITLGDKVILGDEDAAKRPLSGDISGLIPSTDYAVEVFVAGLATGNTKKVTLTTDSQGKIDLSKIDLASATWFGTTYTATSDRVRVKVYENGGSTVLADTNEKTVEWKVIAKATVTLTAVGQHSLMASANIPAERAKLFEDGTTLRYEVFEVDKTDPANPAYNSVFTVPAKANAGGSTFTEDNGALVNYTRISDNRIQPGKTYVVTLKDNSNNSTEATTTTDDPEYTAKAADGTVVFNDVLYERLLQALKNDKIITDKDAKTFKASDLEKWLDKNNGVLDLHLNTNSEKKALTDLTGLEYVVGATSVNLANNNLGNAALTEKLLGKVEGETITAGTFYAVSSINLAGNVLTSIPNFQALQNLGKPSNTEYVNLVKNLIPASEFAKDAFSAKFDKAVIAKVQTTASWGKVAKMAAKQKLAAAPIINVEKQYTALDSKRPLVLHISNAAKAQENANKIYYYLTIKKADGTIIKNAVQVNPNEYGEIEKIFDDIDSYLLPDGDNELVIDLVSKNSNYASVVGYKTVVTYTTSAATLNVDSVAYAKAEISGVTSGTALTRDDSVYQKATDLYVQWGTNKKFRAGTYTTTDSADVNGKWDDEIEPVEDINGEYAYTLEDLDQKTTYYVRLVRKVNGINYALTEPVKFTTKNSGVTIKASKVKVVKGFNSRRLQTDITVKIPKSGRFVVDELYGGFYGQESGYAIGSIGATKYGKSYNTYHIDRTVTYDKNYKYVYACATIKDLKTGETFELYLGDITGTALTSYKKLKGTLKVQTTDIDNVILTGTITGSKINSDLDVYVKVSSSSAFDLREDKENYIDYSNGRFATKFSGLDAAKAYNAKVYVEKPDGTEKVLKKVTFTTESLKATAAIESFTLTPGVANAVATVVVNTQLLDPDVIIKDVDATMYVYSNEATKSEDMDVVKFSLDNTPDGTEVAFDSNTGKYILTAKLSEDVYGKYTVHDDATNTDVDHYKVYVQPTVKVTYKDCKVNTRFGVSAERKITLSAATQSTEKLTDIANKVTGTVSASRIDDKSMMLNGQFTYDGMTGTSIANLGRIMDAYRIKVYKDGQTVDDADVVSGGALTTYDDTSKYKHSIINKNGKSGYDYIRRTNLSLDKGNILYNTYEYKVDESNSDDVSGIQLINLDADTTYHVILEQYIEATNTWKQLDTKDFKTTVAPTAAPAETATPAPKVTLDAITDPVLKKLVENKIKANKGLEETDPLPELTQADLDNVDEIKNDLEGYATEADKVKSLAGIDILKNLETISLRGHAVTDAKAVNNLNYLDEIDLSYNGLTANPGILAVDVYGTGVDVILEGNSIPGLKTGYGKQMSGDVPVIRMADTYYAVTTEEDDEDVEKITTKHPFYFEFDNLGNFTYKLSYSIGSEVVVEGENAESYNNWVDSRVVTPYNNYIYEDLTSFFEGTTPKYKEGDKVSVKVKLEKVADKDNKLETVAEVTKDVTFAGELKATETTVDNKVIYIGKTSYGSTVTVPNQALFETVTGLYAPTVNGYEDDYTVNDRDYDVNTYTYTDEDEDVWYINGDEDSLDNYYDPYRNFLYGDEAAEDDYEKPKDRDDKAIVVSLVDAAGNVVMKTVNTSIGASAFVKSNQAYGTTFANTDKANSVLCGDNYASTFKFSFDGDDEKIVKKAFKNLTPGTYSLQYTLPDGTTTTLKDVVTVKKADAVNYEKKAVISGLTEEVLRLYGTNQARVELVGTDYDYTKVYPVIYTKVNGEMVPTGTLTSSKVSSVTNYTSSSKVWASYEFTNEAGFKKDTTYYVGLASAAGYEYEISKTSKFYEYKYVRVSVGEGEDYESGIYYDKNTSSVYGVFNPALIGSTVSAKLYADFGTNANWNHQTVLGVASATAITTGGAVALTFLKDGAEVKLNVRDSYKVYYTITSADGKTTYTGNQKVAMPDEEEVFDYTRVLDNVNYSGQKYFVTKGVKKVNLNAYMTTTAIKGKKITAEIHDGNSYIKGTSIKLKATKVKGTSYSKVSGTFGGKKLKLEAGLYTVNYYVDGVDIRTISYYTNYASWGCDYIYAIDLASNDFYMTREAEAVRNIDGSITITADTLRAAGLNAKKFKLELTDADDEEITTATVTTKIDKKKNQVVFTVKGVEDIDEVTYRIVYNGKYALAANDYADYATFEATVKGYYSYYDVLEDTEVNGRKKSTVVKVKAATAGAVLTLYDLNSRTVAKAVSIDAIGTYAIKAADLEGLDLGHPYRWVITDYRGVAKATGTDYFYAETPVLKSAEGVITPITGIKTAVNGKTLGLSVGSKFALNGYATPARITPTEVKYSVSKKDKKIISVTADGIIKGKKVGKATVVVTSKDNKKVKAKITVTVGPKATKVTSAKANKNGSVTVKWKKAKSSKKAKVAGYIVYVSSKADGTYKQIAKVSAKKAAVTLKKGLKANKTYYFKVAAYAKSGKSILPGSISEGSKSATVKKVEKKKATKKTTKKATKKSTKKTTKKNKK